MATGRVKRLIDLVDQERELNTDLLHRRLTIGELLRKQRESLGLSMTETRAISGVTESMISLLERGRIWNAAAAMRLAVVLAARAADEARAYTVEHVAS